MSNKKKSLICNVLYILNAIMIGVSIYYVNGQAILPEVLIGTGIYLSWKIGQYEGRNGL